MPVRRGSSRRIARHSSKRLRLPPARFEPVGISFVGASLASPGAMEALEHSLPKDHPLRSLFLADPPAGKPEWTYNMLLKHGVRSCLEYARSFDLKRAHAVSNPKLSPHLEFVDIWAVTAMRRFGSPAMKCGPSSSAFRARSRAATVPMAVLFATGWSTRHRSGNRANGLCCGSKSLRAIPAFRSEIASRR